MQPRLIKSGGFDLLTAPAQTKPERVQNGFRLLAEACAQYSSAQPVSNSSKLRDEPEFFRFVTPAVYSGKVGKAYRFGDSPELRRVCEDDLAWALQDFSPEASLKRARAEKIPDMPLVSLALDGVARDHFKDYQLIAVQHLYASTAGMLSGLADHGLAFEHMTVIGKSYSANYGVAKALVERGVHVPTAQLDQSASEAHDALMASVVRAQLQRYRDGLANGSSPSKLLALDEGGHIVHLLHTEFRDLLPRATAVEQTRRGIFKANSLPQLECAFVDVSSSRLKVANEMPLIAQSLFYEASRKRDHIEQCGFKVPREISIMGLGDLGMATAEKFAKLGWKVSGYDKADIDPDLIPAGVELIKDRTAFLREARMLMPITGQRPISVDDYDLLQNRCVVMNGASSNDEVAAYEAIERARVEQPVQPWWNKAWPDKASYVHGMPDLLADREYLLPATGWIWGEMGNTIMPLGHASRRAQRDRVLHFKDKDIYLTKSGFVLNLTDDVDPIPAKLIQVTRAALALACAQAVTIAGQNGKVALDSAGQVRLTHAFHRMVGDPKDAEWMPSWRETGILRLHSSNMRGPSGVGTTLRNSRKQDMLKRHTFVWQCVEHGGVRVKLSPEHVLQLTGGTEILRSRETATAPPKYVKK